jgi:hypothetical protein
MNNTTRRFPRTLGEAFKDSTYASPITKPNGHVIAFEGAMKPKRVRVGKRSMLWRAARVVRELVRWLRSRRAW